MSSSGSLHHRVLDVLEVRDELYFLVVELRQVLRGHDLMAHFDCSMPIFRQADLIKSWRDIEERWNDPPKGMEIWALRTWQRARTFTRCARQSARSASGSGTTAA